MFIMTLKYFLDFQQYSAPRCDKGGSYMLLLLVLLFHE